MDLAGQLSWAEEWWRVWLVLSLRWEQAYPGGQGPGCLHGNMQRGPSQICTKPCSSKLSPLPPRFPSSSAKGFLPPHRPGSHCSSGPGSHGSWVRPRLCSQPSCPPQEPFIPSGLVHASAHLATAPENTLHPLLLASVRSLCGFPETPSSHRADVQGSPHSPLRICILNIFSSKVLVETQQLHL